MRKLLLAWMVLFLQSSVAMAIEEPAFEVEREYEEFEVRKYGPTLVAQTKVDEAFDDAGNRAFRVLADYIFGKNISKEKISMTAPVTQQSEKISMTAPVSQIRAKDGYLVQFMMPSRYTRATLPAPVDSRVAILEIPARRVAVYSYSGSWSEERYLEKLAEFKGELLKAGVKTVGEAVFARFNSPFQLWFLRRNEIWLQVAE